MAPGRPFWLGRVLLRPVAPEFLDHAGQRVERCPQRQRPVVAVIDAGLEGLQVDIPVGPDLLAEPGGDVVGKPDSGADEDVGLLAGLSDGIGGCSASLVPADPGAVLLTAPPAHPPRLPTLIPPLIDR